MTLNCKLWEFLSRKKKSNCKEIIHRIVKKKKKKKKKIIKRNNKKKKKKKKHYINIGNYFILRVNYNNKMVYLKVIIKLSSWFQNIYLLKE